MKPLHQILVSSMGDDSGLACFSLVRSRSIRIATLGACAYFLIWAINTIIDPSEARHGITFFESDVFPWIPKSILLLLNIAFYAYVAWVCGALIRASRCVEERLIFAALAISLGLGILAGLPTFLANAFANYGDLAVWTVATAAAARMLVRYRDRADQQVAIPLQSGRGFLANVALYIAETFVATAGAMVIVLAALRLLYPTTHLILSNLTRESFTSLNYLPYSPLQIGVALALGYMTALYFTSRSVLFVWIGPMAIVVLDLCSYQPATVFENRWTASLTRLFGTRVCAPPECYDQIFVVALYSAIAFSLGAWIRRRVRANSGLPPTPSQTFPDPT